MHKKAFGLQRCDVYEEEVHMSKLSRVKMSQTYLNMYILQGILTECEKYYLVVDQSR